jgi:hypothetical protein
VIILQVNGNFFTESSAIPSTKRLKLPSLPNQPFEEPHFFTKKDQQELDSLRCNELLSEEEDQEYPDERFRRTPTSIMMDTL